MILTFLIIDGILLIFCVRMAVFCYDLNKAIEDNDRKYCHDSKLLSKEISAVAEDVTTLAEDFRKLDEKVSDAYEVVENQAKKEKLMFDGLTSIMDYDVNTARKAVSGDAE